MCVCVFVMQGKQSAVQFLTRCLEVKEADLQKETDLQNEKQQLEANCTVVE